MARGGEHCRHALPMVALLCVFAVALQFSTASLGSVDGYFHARYAAMVWAGGLRGFPPAFPWLPLTIRSADRYYDHHMLFHVLLAPFTTGDVIRGVKWASAAFAAAAFVAVYGALRRRGVRHAAWWLMAMFAVAPDFLYRMEMPRVQALSLICLLATTELVLARRFAWLLPLAVVYTWLYDAFPLLLMITGSAFVAILALERRVAWRVLAYAMLGVAIGLMVNPYFPKDVWFIAHHYLGKVAIAGPVRMGTEWYPYPLAESLGWGGAVAVLATAAVLAVRGRRQLEASAVVLLLIGAGFFVLVWRSRRFVEYAAPFDLLALAVTLHRWVDGRISQCSPRARRAVAAIVLAGCSVSTYYSFRQLSGRPAPQRYAGGAAWLAAHTPPGAIVVTPDWDDFPLLYFHNQHNRYVIGLDPMYLAQQDAALYALWHRFGRGELTPPSQFLGRFQSSVVLSDHGHGQLLTALSADADMERVYEDGDCVIFRRRG